MSDRLGNIETYADMNAARVPIDVVCRHRPGNRPLHRNNSQPAAVSAVGRITQAHVSLEDASLSTQRSGYYSDRVSKRARSKGNRNTTLIKSMYVRTLRPAAACLPWSAVAFASDAVRHINAATPDADDAHELRLIGTSASQRDQSSGGGILRRQDD